MFSTGSPPSPWQPPLAPRACQLKSGADKFYQVLQLLLQVLLISVVLNDPIEGPDVVQATF